MLVRWNGWKAYSRGPNKNVAQCARLMFVNNEVQWNKGSTDLKA